MAIKVDTADVASMQKLVDFTIKEFGQTEYSINNAGVSPDLISILLPFPIIIFLSKLSLSNIAFSSENTSLANSFFVTKRLALHSYILLQMVNIDISDQILAVNARGTMLCIRGLTKAMDSQQAEIHKGRHSHERSIGRGSIITPGSGLSCDAGLGAMAYVASKHAAMGITKVAGKTYTYLSFLLPFP